MDKETIKRLKTEYDRVCEEYLVVFCDNYDLSYERDAWVAGDKGTIALVGDYYFDFDNVIKYCVDNNLKDIDELLEWYDYTLDAYTLNMTAPNFPSWHRGCPRLSKTQMRRLLSLKQELDNQIEFVNNGFKHKDNVQGGQQCQNLARK